MNRSDLEERLITFSVLIISISQGIQNSNAGIYLSGQIVRSGTSCSLNYGEAQSADSKKDFIHKCKSFLKNYEKDLSV